MDLFCAYIHYTHLPYLLQLRLYILNYKEGWDVKEGKRRNWRSSSTEFCWKLKTVRIDRSEKFRDSTKNSSPPFIHGIYRVRFGMNSALFSQ